MSINTWTSPINTSNRHLVTDILERIGHRLLNGNILDEAKQRCSKDLPQFHFGCSGYLGLALYAGYCSMVFQTEASDSAAHNQLVLSLSGHQNCLDRMELSVGEGLCGVGMTATFLSKGERRYQNLLRAIEETVNHRVLMFLSHSMKVTNASSLHPYDFISGLSGAAAFLTMRQRYGSEQKALVPILKTLVFLAGEDNGILRFYTPPQLLGETFKRMDEFQYGLVNMGLAHGIPGPLAVLAVAHASRIKVEGMEEAIERLSHFIVANCAEDRFGPKWPTAVAVNANGQYGNPSVWCRTAWCYGNPGVSRALWLAGLALRSHPLCELALQGLFASLDRFMAEEDYLQNPTFCHGTAGLLQIVLRFYNDSPSDILAAWANRLISHLISLYQESSLLGFRAIVRDRSFDDPRLFQGATGVALALLGAISDSEPGWDRVFMLN